MLQDVLLQLIIPVEVDKYADVDSGDGQYDARQCDGRELVHKLDPDKYHHPHNQQQARPVDAEVVEHRLLVLREVAE